MKPPEGGRAQAGRAAQPGPGELAGSSGSPEPSRRPAGGGAAEQTGPGAPPPIEPIRLARPLILPGRAGQDQAPDPAPARPVPPVRLWRRLLSPVGLLLIGLCFAFPFVTVSCSSPEVTVTADYSGADLLVGGAPAVEVTGDEIPDRAQEEGDDPIDMQPTALLAVLALAGGLVAAALPSAWHRLLGGAAAAASAALLLVANQVVAYSYLRRQLDEQAGPLLPAGTDAGDFVHSRYGFWLALALALAVTAVNAVELLRLRGGAGAPPGQPQPPGGPAPPGH